MGRPRTGSVRYRAGMGWVAELAGEHLGYAKTEDEARELVAAALAHDEQKAPHTVRTFGARWIARREIEARKRGKSRSGLSERSRWQTHVEAASWADKPLRAITPKMLQQWVRELATTHATHAMQTGPRRRKVVERRQTERTLSRSTISNTLQLVKLCLDDAVIEGLLATNPARLVKLGRAAVKQHEGELVDHLSAAEIAKLFALELPARERAFFSLAIYGGLRLGELLGLQWRDVADYQRIQVRRAYAIACKNRGAVRDVPMLPPVAAALRAYRSESSTPAIGTSLLFPTDSGSCHGPSYNMQWTDKPYRKGGRLQVTEGWARKAGVVGKSIQVLRHTCGCHLLMGTWAQWTGPIELKDVTAWLGHSDYGVTQRHYAAFARDSLTNRVRQLLAAKTVYDGRGDLSADERSKNGQFRKP
jgi:integrase